MDLCPEPVTNRVFFRDDSHIFATSVSIRATSDTFAPARSTAADLARESVLFVHAPEIQMIVLRDATPTHLHALFNSLKRSASTPAMKFSPGSRWSTSRIASPNQLRVSIVSGNRL
jgi:hypothetical protein